MELLLFQLQSLLLGYALNSLLYLSEINLRGNKINAPLYSPVSHVVFAQ